MQKNNNVIFTGKISRSAFLLITIIIPLTLSVAFNLYYINSLSYKAFAQTEKNINTNITATSNILSLSNLINYGSPYLGNESAPVTIVDFSDFQCHLCKRFVDLTEPEINSTFIQTGKATMVFKHFPIRGFDSISASLAAQCTNDQGKFWQYHNILYKNQKGIDSGWVSKENLKKFASQIPGLDTQKFNSCLNDKNYQNFIDNDIALAKSFGFRETPSFIIMKSDGSSIQKIAGPQPFASFEFIISKLLE